MSTTLKNIDGKDCISIHMPDDNNITVTGDFFLCLSDSTKIEFTAKISCVLSDTDINLTHDIVWIEPEYINSFDIKKEDIECYFNILIRIVNFRMNIEIKTL